MFKRSLRIGQTKIPAENSQETIRKESGTGLGTSWLWLEIIIYAISNYLVPLFVYKRALSKSDKERYGNDGK